MREYRTPRYDGSVVHVSDGNHIVRDVHGTAIRIVGGITDISPRWEMEQALRLSEARYRQLAGHSAVGIFLQVLHPERRFDYLNPAMEAMIGYPREAVYADPSLITGAIPEADRERMRTELERSEAVSAPLEVELRHRDGQLRHVRIRDVPQRDATGRVVHVQAVVTDVTREHLERLALRQALDEQRDLSDFKTGFVQAVSHELRTPLISIRGFVELLLGRELEPAEQRRYLLRVASGADRLDRLVADVIEQERIDLADLARRAAAEADTGTHPLNLDLYAVPVMADGALLERVLDNLIRNAVKHTPEATPVWIRTRAPGTIVVEDAGPGVREAVRETRFEPFRPGPDQRQHPTPGIGIGLALSHRIVRLHHGEVVYDERPGGGSRFTVTLPPR